jgi:hypothetical protein
MNTSIIGELITLLTGALFTLTGFGVISLSKDKIEVEKWKKARTCMKIAGPIMITCSLISLFILIFMKK